MPIAVPTTRRFAIAAKLPGRRELQEHAPVGQALVPAGAGAQPERAVEIG